MSGNIVREAVIMVIRLALQNGLRRSPRKKPDEKRSSHHHLSQKQAGGVAKPVPLPILLPTPTSPRARLRWRREQTDGRGRMGRRWEAPAGSSLLVSTLLRPPPERRAAELTLLAGVAVAVVVERATGLAAQIKWPNDVMLNRRKVAGVLAELKDAAVVLGIGINVNQRPDGLPTQTKAAAGSLYSVTGRGSERGELTAPLLLELERRVRRLAR